jgi:hypothetical protein
MVSAPVSDECGVESSHIGLYVLLFILSLRILLRRNPGEKQVLVVTSLTMLLLGTSQTILWVFTTGISVRMTQVLVEQDAVDSLSRLWRLYFTLDVAQNIVFVTNKSISFSRPKDNAEILIAV